MSNKVSMAVRLTDPYQARLKAYGDAISRQHGMPMPASQALHSLVIKGLVADDGEPIWVELEKQNKCPATSVEDRLYMLGLVEPRDPIPAEDVYQANDDGSAVINFRVDSVVAARLDAFAMWLNRNLMSAVRHTTTDAIRTLIREGLNPLGSLRWM